LESEQKDHSLRLACAKKVIENKLGTVVPGGLKAKGSLGKTTIPYLKNRLKVKGLGRGSSGRALAWQV
jgi:hypothetical protein